MVGDLDGRERRFEIVIDPKTEPGLMVETVLLGSKLDQRVSLYICPHNLEHFGVPEQAVNA